tara:strand:+ start:49 stop:543 length:495 start_codon:yes stop_codon:yes gene_type:complete
MANTNRTDVTIKGSKEAIKYFQEKYDDCVDGKYPAEEGQTHIIDAFGAEAELLIDRIGSKWISKFEVFVDDENEFEFAMESAWYPPSDMLKEMHHQLAAIDPDIIFTARYWDEVYDPIGVLKITDAGQYLTLEDNSIEDDDREYFWDDVIEPAFQVLEKKLNIK